MVHWYEALTPLYLVPTKYFFRSFALIGLHVETCCEITLFFVARSWYVLFYYQNKWFLEKHDNLVKSVKGIVPVVG